MKKVRRGGAVEDLKHLKSYLINEEMNWFNYSFSFLEKGISVGCK